MRMIDKQEVSAMVLRIEKGSIYDGAGLRTVVFLKGCNLHCLWCSTPESQGREAELGFSAKLCHKCGACIQSCRNRALSRNNEGKIVVDKKLCRHSLQCQNICPYRALVNYGYEATVQEVLNEVLKDEIFYFHSGGGLTVSGGEPLLQADFVTELFKLCRKNGINTALESAFSVPWPLAIKPLPYLNTLFVDIKHSDSELHEQYTGMKNDLILANIVSADKSPYPFDLVIRLPLIPNINDDESNLCKTAAFAAGLHKLKYLEILPYHRLGYATYDKLGREYLLRDLPTPNSAYIEQKRAILQSCKADIQIRG
ncbi:MAG: glycyl-radical enzyme activating protein [Firmicutes bacterium]|nr:glycyl-radical enzyme activating protein [Bacillota bacterium]